MFNQKLHKFLSENEDYLNVSYSAPVANAMSIHNCTYTITNSYKNTPGFASQTWSDKNVAVENFAMRPIVNSTEYFSNIKDYLSQIIISDRDLLESSGLLNETYNPLIDPGTEPLTTFISMINLDVTNKLSVLMANSADNIEIFKNYNPINEGFVMTDIKINTYVSDTDQNHFYNLVVFSAVNTTRYNTVSFKAEVYQNTTDKWNQETNELSESVMYIYNISLLNDTNCVLGNEEYCNINKKLDNFSTVDSSTSTGNLFLQDISLSNNKYNLYGNYDSNGDMNIIDYGPDNIENIIKDLGY